MNDNTIGQRILAARKNAGIKQKDLAGSLGLTPTALNYYEKGKRTPSIEVLKHLSALLHISMDYLLGLETSQATPLKTALTSGQLPAAAQLLHLPKGALLPAQDQLLLASLEAVPYQSQAGGIGLSYQDLAQILSTRQSTPPSPAWLQSMAHLLPLLAHANEEELAKLLGMAHILVSSPA